MPRVSLILPTDEGDPRPDDSVPTLREELERAGLEVEMIVASGPRPVGGAPPPPDGARLVIATHPGLASAAMAGLEAASGDILVVLDPRMGYPPEAVPALVAPLEAGRADLVVASRFVPGSPAGRIGLLIGTVARPFTGSTDPLSGLLGMTRKALDGSFGSFRAVGTKYSLEFLSKIEGSRLDVPVRVGPGGHLRLPVWDDVRHLKRLADHRYGNMSRLVQFCFVGASGAVVDLSCYFVFQKAFGGTPLADRTIPTTRLSMALAAARASAIAVALVWNFSLNRRMTFSYARQGSLPRQFAAYVASNLLGVMVSMALSLGLPVASPFFNAHKLMAAVVGIVAATGISFSMARWVVFRRKPGADADELAEALRSEPRPSAAAEVAEQTA